MADLLFVLRFSRSPNPVCLPSIDHFVTGFALIAELLPVCLLGTVKILGALDGRLVNLDLAMFAMSKLTLVNGTLMN